MGSVKGVRRVSNPRPRRLRRAAAWCAVAAVLLSGAGFAYESAAERDDARRYPAPGRLVGVAGHRLHLHCTGEGSPTVVLEAGLAESSVSWAGVQRALSARGRVCSYDRAGYAWSDTGPAPRTASRAAEDLRALLAAAGERAPYVLVAHSYGGQVARLFAGRWRDLTAGLVLIDVTDETQLDALAMSRPLLAAQFTAYGLLARTGVLRLTGDALAPGDATAEARAAAPVVYGARSMAAARSEAWAALRSAAEVAATVRPGAWGDLPVAVVIPSGQPEGAVGRARSLAALSTRGRVLTAATTEHYVQMHEPRVVLGAVGEVVDAARATLRKRP
ncbi:Pimeloyl-ACP methyl ester carboxylesterase [Nonomuraea pusilla]|uniref:Pimeloyl-ACP methyl ester carboxylesterase n=1 Tax=Nonomuraea pusilla TaxID=46177 RepID=A0A1H7VN96_9ACTN|nr:Pimeloyl-ACP methyl ester carboxylesterase [Nonomuraea pusilla]